MLLNHRNWLQVQHKFRLKVYQDRNNSEKVLVKEQFTLQVTQNVVYSDVKIENLHKFMFSA